MKTEKKYETNNNVINLCKGNNCNNNDICLKCSSHLSYDKIFAFYDEKKLRAILLEALELNHKDKIKILKTTIDCGLDINKILENKNELRLIHLLTNYNDIGCIGYLSKNTNCKLNSLTKNKENVAHICAYKNYYHLLKHYISYNINIHQKDKDGDTPLDIACINQHEESIKILIGAGADIDIDDDPNFSSPLTYYIRYSKFYKETKNKNNELNNEFDNSIIDDEYKKIINMVNFFGENKKKLNDEECDHIIELIINKKIKYTDIKLLFEKFPHLINRKSICNSTILEFAIKNDEKLADFLIDLNINTGIFKNINNDGLSYIHYACKNFKINIIKKLLEKNKDLLYSLDKYNNTPLEYVIIYYKHNKFNLEVDKMSINENIQLFDIAKIFFDNNYDVNRISNKFDVTILDLIVNYSNDEQILEYVLKKTNRIIKPTKNTYLSPFLNRDLYGNAAKLGKTEFIKLLLKYNIDMHIVNNEERDIYLPSCLINSLVYNKSQTFQYLYNIYSVSKYINFQTKKYLSNLAIKNYIYNEDILDKIFTKNEIRNYQQNKSDIMIKYYLQAINKNSEDTELKKHVPKLILKMINILLIFNKTLFRKTKSKNKELQEFIKKMDYIYDIVYDDIDFIDAGFSSIVYFLDNPNLNLIGIFRNLNYYIEKYKCKDSTQDELIKQFVNIKKSNSYLTSKDFENLENIKTNLEKIIALNPKNYEEYKINKKNICVCETCNKRFKENEDDKDIEYLDCLNGNNNETNSISSKDSSSINSYNKDDIMSIYDDKYSYIEDDCSLDSLSPEENDYLDEYNYELKSNINRVLKKLREEDKVLHYDKLCESMIKSMDDKFEDDSNEIVINYNYNKKEVILKVFKLKTYNKPTTWFKYYARNIGCFSKPDINHNLSYFLDRILPYEQCIELNTYDKDRDKIFKCLFFVASISTKINGKNVEKIGCIEYFIDSEGILFHRMFRPYDYLPLNVKTMITPKIKKYLEDVNVLKSD